MQHDNRQELGAQDAALPVCNPQLVTEFKGHKELLEESSCIILSKAFAVARRLIADDKLKHVAPCRKLHYDCQMVGGEEDLPELHYVWVDHAQPVVEDLSQDALVYSSSALKELDGYL